MSFGPTDANGVSTRRWHWQWSKTFLPFAAPSARAARPGSQDSGLRRRPEALSTRETARPTKLRSWTQCKPRESTRQTLGENGRQDNAGIEMRSEEHTSELQSRQYL